MKIAVIGSRDFNDYCFMKKKIKSVLFEFGLECKYFEIVSGGARGADSLAERFAYEFSLKKTIIHPDWKKYGKSAGKIRNTKIIALSDIVIAFWNGISGGTFDSIQKAKIQQKLLYVFHY